MKKKGLKYLSVCILFFAILAACEKDDTVETTDDETANNSADYTNSGDNASAENCTSHEVDADYIWNSADEIAIILNGSEITVGSGNVSIDGSKATITSAGTYKISGPLTNGQIIVNTEDEATVRLILCGADITCSNSSPIYIKKCSKAIIILADSTENRLTDGTVYVYDNTEDKEPCATIFSKANLTIYGNGSLTIGANFNDGISTKDGLVINIAGSLNVNSADDGIRGKNYLIIRNGNITVNTIGDGFKSDNDNDAAMGYISVDKATINITSLADGISAQTDVIFISGEIKVTSGGGSNKTVSGSVSAKGIKSVVNLIIEGGNFVVNSADDALHSDGNMAINGGNIYISSGDDGMHAEASIIISNSILSITESYEGIESPAITINSGDVSIMASDDGFNASKGDGGEADDGSCLTITGGTIYVNASGGDGLDSNGSIAISGGTILTHGPKSQPEVGMDYNGTCNVTGGMLVVSGPNSGNMIQGPSTSSTQNSLKFIATSNLSTSTLFHIQDADGNDILTYQPLRSYYSIVFSSSTLLKGSVYYLYTGGTYTGGTLVNGLYTGGTYSGGTAYSTPSFTVSSSVTSVGSASGGGGSGGGPGGRP